MTQENKEILLKDLGGRLSYGVKILDIHANVAGNLFLISTTDTVEYETNDGTGIQTLYNIKPYLRPMSSMTDEEKEVVCSMNMISDTELNDRLNYQRMYLQNYTIETFDYFNERKLDYRGLIPMGLAIEAPEGMYKTE